MGKGILDIAFDIAVGVLEKGPGLVATATSAVVSTATSRGSSAHESPFAGISEACEGLKIDFGALLNGAGVEPQALNLGHSHVAQCSLAEDPIGHTVASAAEFMSQGQCAAR